MALSNITVCLKKMTSSFVPSQCSFLCASCGLQNPFYRVALTELSMKGFSFLCSVLCMLVQKKNFHSQKVSEYKQLLFSIYHIIKTKRQKWVQVALSLWSYWYSFPPPPSATENGAPRPRATVVLLILGHILLLFFGGCKMT